MIGILQTVFVHELGKVLGRVLFERFLHADGIREQVSRTIFARMTEFADSIQPMNGLACRAFRTIFALMTEFADSIQPINDLACREFRTIFARMAQFADSIQPINITSCWVPE
ncbi:hypothetical protein AVEN_46832-1 [Araneus ventricosus]|uniref:Uncharacterized protein n=1 Tax=Araneus ventricosus TaxID=182803 RepID=A0A4Y2MAZ9_ARAVE|nr:hypothetical protein AVEN_46832-1 [Araneus ventricosus]